MSFSTTVIVNFLQNTINGFSVFHIPEMNSSDMRRLVENNESDEPIDSFL